MECLCPVEGRRMKDGTVKMLGERSDNPLMRSGLIEVPCGRCTVCRLERSRQWAVRMMLEAQTVEEASFVTLTYDDEHMPLGRNVDRRDFQLFFKRLRKRLPNQQLTYFHCGEYGDRKGRPHYHAAVFGESFLEDAESLKPTAKGFRQWTSPLLRQVWKLGHVAAMDLTFDSAQYLAKYMMKRRTGEPGPDGRAPEYATMSKRPAIGRRWFEEFHQDVYPHDELVVAGRPGKPPKYFDGLLEAADPAMYARVKKQRQEEAHRRYRQEDHLRKRREQRQEFWDRRAAKAERELS